MGGPRSDQTLLTVFLPSLERPVTEVGPTLDMVGVRRNRLWIATLVVRRSATATAASAQSSRAEQPARPPSSRVGGEWRNVTLSAQRSRPTTSSTGIACRTARSRFAPTTRAPIPSASSRPPSWSMRRRMSTAARRYGGRARSAVRSGDRPLSGQRRERAATGPVSPRLAGVRLVRVPARALRTAGRRRQVRLDLGYETNYAKDNQAFSRAYLFNFLPFYHTGLRVSLPVH